MSIGVLTSLYPSPERPFEGIFAARKWEGMVARGHDVRVVVPTPWAPRLLAGILPATYAEHARVPASEERGGVRVERPRYLHLPGRAIPNARSFTRAGVTCMSSGASQSTLSSGTHWRPDVVVCDYAWPSAAAVGAFAQAGIPVVVNGRGSDILQVRAIDALRGALSDGLRAADGLTAVSQDLLDAMVELAGGVRTTALTPNGVDAQRFAPGSKSEARERLGLARDRRIVLVVGHLIERKDPLLSLATFEHATRDEAPGDAQLVVIGRGPLMGDLERAGGRHDLAAQVALLGERPPEELVDWYRAADVLLLTSSREGRPNVVLEALSVGCPVLATDAGGTGEIVSDERMLARTRDAAALGGMLRALLESPPDPNELRASVAHLTWDASLDALEAILAAVCAPAAEPDGKPSGRSADR